MACRTSILWFQYGASNNWQPGTGNSIIPPKNAAPEPPRAETVTRAGDVAAYLDRMPGGREPVFHSRRFRLTLGNGSVRMKINGKELQVPQSANAISYVVTPAGRHSATAAQAPHCP